VGASPVSMASRFVDAIPDLLKTLTSLTASMNELIAEITSRFYALLSAMRVLLSVKEHIAQSSQLID